MNDNPDYSSLVKLPTIPTTLCCVDRCQHPQWQPEVQFLCSSFLSPSSFFILSPAVVSPAPNEALSPTAIDSRYCFIPLLFPFFEVSELYLRTKSCTCSGIALASQDEPDHFPSRRQCCTASPDRSRCVLQDTLRTSSLSRPAARRRESSGRANRPWNLYHTACFSDSLYRSTRC